MKVNIMITRKQYMTKEATHREYYGQFVTPSIIKFVVDRIGQKRIADSTDPHLNDIQLEDWDALEPFIQSVCLNAVGDAEEAGWTQTPTGRTRKVCWTLSTNTCIAKEAARQWLDEKAAGPRSVSEIALEISSDWSNVHFAARPYLNSMFSLCSINGSDWNDSAASVVRYFLANASSWRGPIARKVKAELKALLQEAGR